MLVLQLLHQKSMNLVFVFYLKTSCTSNNFYFHPIRPFPIKDDGMQIDILKKSLEIGAEIVNIVTPLNIPNPKNDLMVAHLC